jgi:hypothetical protein
MRSPFRSAAAAALALTAVLSASCRQPSDESRIRGLLERAVALAEKKDAAGLRDLFTPDYKDFQGRDAVGTLGLITGYLDRYRNIVIHLLAARVGEAGPDGLTTVECEVSLSHGAAEILRRLVRYSGEYYSFRMDVRRDGAGEWRFAAAEWRSINLVELSPEALAVLRKLFPGL